MDKIDQSRQFGQILMAAQMADKSQLASYLVGPLSNHNEGANLCSLCVELTVHDHQLPNE